MVPVLLIANAIIWGNIYKIRKQDLAEAELFDWDLYKLSKAEFPEPISPTIDDRDEDIILKQSFEEQIRQQIVESCMNEEEVEKVLPQNYWDTYNKTKQVLEEQGLLTTTDIVWCEGYPLKPGDKKDLKRFYEIRGHARLTGFYNDKPLEDGGEYDLKKALFMLKGCSDYGAEQLVDMGVNPDDFDWEVPL